MAVTQISGRAGRFQINAVNFNIDKEDVTISTTTGEITGFEDQGGDGRTPVNRGDGNDDLVGTIEGPVDSAAMPASSAQPIKQGSILTNVKFYLDKNVAPRYAGTTRAIVESIQYTVDQKGVATRYRAQIKNAGGTITNPT